nr:E-beta-farnesene synthase [Tanacetum cinerariifolium]
RMADVNVNAPADQAPIMAPSTRTDDQILPHIRWVPVGKSNCYLDTLRDALQITPVNDNNAFSSPPTLDALINFVNNLGYPKVIRNLSDVVTNDMFQPWRALTTIINMCLTGKTLGFERPKASVQKEYSTTYSQKEESYPYYNPEYRFTKLIIYYLQSKYKFHPRPDSLLHLPNEEPVLGYLMFSAKGTKREVFGMPIPNKLITVDIQGKQYYKECLEKVAKHQRYLAVEKGSDLDSPALKPAKATKKSKPSVPKEDLRPPIIKPTLSQQPKPKPAPAKSQGKKRKLVTETSDKPSLARRSKLGLVTKRCKPTSSLRSVDESIVEGILEKEPRFDDKEADIQRAVEESLKSVYDAPRVPLPPVVIREPDSGKFQPLPEVQGKGKEKFIFLRRTSTPTESSGHDESSSLYDELGLTDSEVKSYEEVPGIDAGVILEEPASSTGTLSSLQHLAKDSIFGDLFFNDKPSEAENEKTMTETETKSMVSFTIQKDTSTIPPMTPSVIDLTSRPDSPKRIGELEQIMANLIQDNKHLEERLESYRARLYILENLDIPQKRLSRSRYKRDSSPMNVGHQLLQSTQKKKKRRDSSKTPPGSPPHQLPPLPTPGGPSGTLGSLRAFGSSQILPPPPLPLSTNEEGQSHGSTSPSSSKTAASAEYKAWTTTDIRLRPSVSLTLEDLYMDNDMAPDAQVHSSDDEDIRNAHIPKYQKEECHKLLTDSMDESIIRHNVSKPLPLGGLPGHVIIQSYFFKKDLEHLRYSSKGSRPVLLILKMKAAYYPDVGLEQMVPDQMWIEEECKYDIAAMYGISHWWFQRQRFNINRHTSEGDRRAVRTHMPILSVVRIDVFSKYGYDYMKKIVLRRADLNEHIIMEKDFKYLYPSEFEDLYLMNLQGHLNHLPPKDKKSLTTAVNLWTKHLVIRQHVEDFQLGIESYQTQLNLTKPRWDATSFEYKHDFTIDEASDYRVKEFKVSRINPRLNIRFSTRKYVDRSKEFMFAIQKWLKTRRIFHNLESFVGGRVRGGDYRLLKRTE